MKNYFVLILLVSSSFCNAQDKKNSIEDHFNKTFSISNADRFSSAVYVKGKTADLLIKTLLKDTKMRGQVHNVNKMKIEGIDAYVKLHILEGIHTYNRNNETFNFIKFKNKKEKELRLGNLNINQKQGIVIYFKINGSDVVSYGDLNLITNHLKSLL